MYARYAKASAYMTATGLLTANAPSADIRARMTSPALGTKVFAIRAARHAPTLGL